MPAIDVKCLPKKCGRVFDLNMAACPDLLIWLACVCSRDLLSLPFKHWDYRQGTHLRAVDVGPGVLDFGSQACRVSALPAEPSPQPPSFRVYSGLGMQLMSSYKLDKASTTEPSGSQPLTG